METTKKAARVIDEPTKAAKPVKLQLRDGAAIDPQMAVWISEMIAGDEKWSRASVEAKGQQMKILAGQIFSFAMTNLVQEDLDKFVVNMEEMFDANGKKIIWDNNHTRILWAISNLTAKNNCFPSRSEISKETGLTRVTINKHLKNYYGSPQQQERQEDFVIMRERILAAAFKEARNGDMRAAKLFLDATANQAPSMHVKNQQNNFIQINGMEITEQQVNELPEDQRLQLQTILSLVKPAK
jgi:hypothetical protein